MLAEHPQLVKQKGELEKAQLPEPLNDPAKYPRERHDFILEMMQDEEIGLCFRLPGTQQERYLVPEALPADDPIPGDYWDDALRFRYAYDLLPRSLIPRLIVESHREAVQQKTRWLTGVVLEVSDCPIRIEADLDKKQVDLWVKGPERRRRGALQVALTHLQHVHELNKNLGEKALVPLPGNPRAAISYEELLSCESDPELGSGQKVKPEGADRAYTVAELLEGVREEGRLLPAERLAAAPAPAVVATAPSGPAADPWNRVMLWSVAGVLALAVLLWWIPSVEGKATVGGLAALAAGTAYFVRGLNPALFYRRNITLAIAVLFALPPLFDFAVQAGRQRYGEGWWLQFDGRQSDWFYPSVALVIIALIAGDVVLRWKGRS